MRALYVRFVVVQRARLRSRREREAIIDRDMKTPNATPCDVWSRSRIWVRYRPSWPLPEADRARKRCTPIRPAPHPSIGRFSFRSLLVAEDIRSNLPGPLPWR